ncbi:hypothetical protein [Marinomonas spartinae]|uniref:hypothetical protein n=1 Tax=Marinomonas spartinae TaxID=1792290 RepID=UPI0018F153C0|nr:hypothetical protein [Marinomonas spartinae]MBJ7553350.1 hypothetical protein [Marinomonas spartinae]
MDNELSYKLDFINHFKSNGFDISDSTFDLALSRFLDSFDTYKMALFAFQKEIMTAVTYLEEINDQTAKGLHILKGGFATFGFMTLSTHAYHLETQLKSLPSPLPSSVIEKIGETKRLCYAFNDSISCYFEQIEGKNSDQTSVSSFQTTSHANKISLATQVLSDATRPTDSQRPQTAEMDLDEELVFLLNLVENCNLRSLDHYQYIEKKLEKFHFDEVNVLRNAMQSIDFESAKKALNSLIKKEFTY